MVGIIYGSSMGNTEDAANMIAANLELESEVANVADTDPSKLNKFDALIVGTSTWNDGELQDDWNDFDFDALDVEGKTVAFFGLGDASSYSDTFCDGMGELYKKFKEKGAKIVGQILTDGYEFDESKAVVDGKFIGLALDNDNESEKTESRIKDWVKFIKPNFI